MKKEYNPKRAETLAAQSPEMREALKGEKMIPPHIDTKIDDDQPRRADFRTDLSEKRSQRRRHGDLAAKGARAVRGIGGQCAHIPQSSVLRS